VESLLFDAFIPAAYRHDLTRRWPVHKPEEWLTFLARHLEHTISGPDLAWWQLPLAVPVLVFDLVFGLVAGLAAGLVAGLVFGLVAGLAAGLVAGLAVGLATEFYAPSRARVRAPSRGLRWRPTVVDVILALVLAAVSGNLVRITHGLAAGLGFGLVVWPVIWYVFGLEGAEIDLTAVATPLVVLARDRRAGLMFGLLWGLVFGLLFGLTAGLTLGFAAGLTFGFAAGLTSGLFVGVTDAIWVFYLTVRVWLGLRHSVPWALMSFLADAHRRGVFRQAGAVYQFRHIELQHRLATRPSTSTRDR
jgi:hypothetical protein